MTDTVVRTGGQTCRRFLDLILQALRTDPPAPATYLAAAGDLRLNPLDIRDSTRPYRVYSQAVYNACRQAAGHAQEKRKTRKEERLDPDGSVRLRAFRRIAAEASPLPFIVTEVGSPTLAEGGLFSLSYRLYHKPVALRRDLPHQPPGRWAHEVGVIRTAALSVPFEPKDKRTRCTLCNRDMAIGQQRKHRDGSVHVRRFRTELMHVIDRLNRVGSGAKA